MYYQHYENIYINILFVCNKLSDIFQREIEQEFNVKADLQRLFFRGKQLENGYKLYDYNINLNDVIQLMMRVNDDVEIKATSSSSAITTSSDSEKGVTDNSHEDEMLIETESLYYKLGDAVDCLDQTYGAWFEAIILKIYKKEDKLIYNVRWEFDDNAPPFNIPELSIRPRARCLIQFDALKIGQKVMINHNVDNPKETGLWYDFTILKIDKKRRTQELTGTLHIGR